MHSVDKRCHVVYFSSLEGFVRSVGVDGLQQIVEAVTTVHKSGLKGGLSLSNVLI